jgi:lysophospholipase L1-like esterase
LFARSLNLSMEMWKYATQLKQAVPNPQLGFAHAPSRSAFLMGVQVDINSYGHRDREYSMEVPDDAYRILMLGDSTTFGWGVPVEQTISEKLEMELNTLQVAGYPRFEVLNAGVGNYNTVQEVAHYLAYDRAFQPDLVILQYFINDAEPVPQARDPGLRGRSYLRAFIVSAFDGIMRVVGARLDWKAYYAALYEDGRPGFEASKHALARLAEITKQDGTRLLVAILPELHEINGEYPCESQHEKIKDVLTAHGIPAVELIDGLRGHGPVGALWVAPTDPHPNGRASSLIVPQLAAWILRDLQRNQTHHTSTTHGRPSATAGGRACRFRSSAMPISPSSMSTAGTTDIVVSELTSECAY